MHRPDREEGSQERPQQSLQAKPPLSPWSPTADPEEMLSDCTDTFDTSGFEGTSDNSREPSVFGGNNQYNEAGVPTFPHWGDDLEQENEDFYGDTSLETGGLATGLMEPSQDAPESRIPCAPCAQAAENPIESFGRAVGISMPGRLIQTPSIVVSNTACDEVPDGNPRDPFEPHSSIHMLTRQVGTEESTEQHSCGTHAVLQRSTRPGVPDKMDPNNYEMATQDRQPPDKPTGIEPRSEKIAAASLNAFCADADSTAADAAAANPTDTESSLVKRPRLSETHHGFQTPAKRDRSLMRGQIPLGKPPISSPVQNSSQVPTPPLSSIDLPTCQYPDNILSRNNTLHAQTTQACDRPVEPWTPVSPSPSILPRADDPVARCPECSDVVFSGSNQKNSLQRHIRDRHNGMPRLECLVRGCTVTFAPGRKDNRLKHVRVMHPDHPVSAPSTKRKRKNE